MVGFGFASQPDVRSPSRHVRRDGDRADGTGARHDPGFLGVVLRVQHLARHAGAAQSPGKRLRLGHGGRADEHRPADRVRGRDVSDDGTLLRLAVGEDQIVAIACAPSGDAWE